MKHYADNLGSNVAAMIKVRQVDYSYIVQFLCTCERGRGGNKKCVPALRSLGPSGQSLSQFP